MTSQSQALDSWTQARAQIELDPMVQALDSQAPVEWDPVARTMHVQATA